MNSFAWRWEIVPLTASLRAFAAAIFSKTSATWRDMRSVLSLLLFFLGRLDLLSCRLPTGKLQLELRDSSVQLLLGFLVGAGGLPLLELGQLDLQLMLLLSRWHCTLCSS